MLPLPAQINFLLVRVPWHSTLFPVTQITHSAHVSDTVSVLLQLRQVVTYPIWLIYSTFMRLFRNPQPAITLKDPEVKYALRLIDKEVGACAVLSVTSPRVLWNAYSFWSLGWCANRVDSFVLRKGLLYKSSLCGVTCSSASSLFPNSLEWGMLFGNDQTHSDMCQQKFPNCAPLTGLRDASPAVRQNRQLFHGQWHSTAAAITKLVPVTVLIYCNIFQEERCLSHAVLTVPKLSQLFYSLLKVKPPSTKLNACSSGIPEEGHDAFRGGSCHQKLVTKLVGSEPKPLKLKSLDFYWINILSK